MSHPQTTERGGVFKRRTRARPREINLNEDLATQVARDELKDWLLKELLRCAGQMALRVVIDIATELGRYLF